VRVDLARGALTGGGTGLDLASEERRRATIVWPNGVWACHREAANSVALGLEGVMGSQLD